MTDDTATRSGPGRSKAGWLFIAIWLVYLIQPLSETLSGKQGTFALWFGVAGFAAFSVTYSRLAHLNRLDGGATRASREQSALLAGLTVLAVLIPVFSVADWMALWIYVSCAYGFTLPMGRPNWALRGGLGATATICVLGPLVGLSLSGWITWILPGLFTCTGMLGIRRMHLVIDELREAREEVKRLAASEERLRMARDLHDLAGHSLATITLKAELARKLLPVDTQSAERQLLDIEQVSRQSLADFREAVSGYRRPTLAVESASARNALDAAGIGFDADPCLVARSGAPDLDPDAEAALAWCLREAVTNVVRHSGAARCTVRLVEARVDGAATLTLDVRDDGPLTPAPGGPAGSGGEESRAAAAWGNGLTGLSERLEPLCAVLTAEPVWPHGFRVTATVPLDRPAPV